MNSSYLLLVFMLLAANWVFSIIFYTRLLAEKSIRHWMKSKLVIRKFAAVITIAYYGMFFILALGLISLVISIQDYAFFIAVAPVLLVLLMFLRETNEYTASYADRLSILMLFFISSLAFVPLGFFGLLWLVR